MSKRGREAKGKLMREAEAVIDELLSWEEEVEAPDLSQIEAVVLKLRQRLGDGAPWIWNLSHQHFFDSVQTVDWYHASQHLYAAAQGYYPDNPAWVQRWYNQAQTTLFQGSVDKIIKSLHKRAKKQPQTAEILATEAGYFENNKHRMDYLEFREEGYLIGSGMVESGAKQFKARFTDPGMR